VKLTNGIVFNFLFFISDMVAVVVVWIKRMDLKSAVKSTRLEDGTNRTKSLKDQTHSTLQQSFVNLRLGLIE
jgi:hypothetical protein